MRLQPRFAWLLAVGAAVLVSVNRLTGYLSYLNFFGIPAANRPIVGAAAIATLLATLILLIIRRGNPYLLLSVQAITTFGTALLLGDGWFSGAFLCAGILLTLHGRRTWFLLALVAVSDATVGWHFSGGYSFFAYIIVVDVANGFALFAIARLAQLIQQAHRDRKRLTEAEARAERLRSDTILSADVGTQISVLIRRLRNALAAPVMARDMLEDVSELARQATSDARAIAAIPRKATSPAPAEDAREHGVSAELARWAFILILIDFTATCVINLFWIGRVSHHLVPGFVIIAVATALQIHHGTPRVGSPRWWPWTFGAQVAIIAVATLTHFTVGELLPFLLIAAGTALVRIPTPWSWLVVGSFATYAFLARAHVGEAGVTSAYWAVGAVYWAVVIYALHKLPEITQQLRATQDQLARLAVVAERLRFSRDVHDLFGFHFSAINLKAELAIQTVGSDESAARSHLATALHHAEQALAEVRSISASAQRITLGAELQNATALLEAAGITVTAPSATPVLPQSIDNLAGILIREATTNVVRHARARTCAIDVAVQDRSLRLCVSNDGATAGDRSNGGSGLANLATRVHGAGGIFNAASDDGLFTLTARIPVYATGSPEPPQPHGVSAPLY
jgi:two-component system, NarL family, sensor histidine kinase DesK